MLHNLTSNDLVKDGFLAVFGFLPTALSPAHVALILGILNIVVVIIFRLIELHRRDRRDVELAILQAQIAELKAGNRKLDKKVEER